ncbi:MAG: gamma-glutamylcyclotransferase family protein [Acidimicrobiia bacterium]
MAEVAPGAEFQFIAHLPEWGLEFPIHDGNWDGSLPTVTPQEGSTVWGAVFEVPRKDFGGLDEAEADECRIADEVEAMDRNGKRHQVTVHLFSPNGDANGANSPSPSYLELMLRGSRHWSLPAGWIAGLQEHIENGH